ncbi:hypothetical protein L227DRAFT_609685 [Lentinus tigrinus ALCF2SS1-6]|uniref:DUF6533 domain-containing protein n=1 Tax=Lentinus tigrinus ALCF2SS1-6 TaxID=1328759 RepID=A0A5C2SFD4_9APHY|nr:hypothetical protein L227DRAFT_609685 [Lentinus tigrinus ALCF2SS1-6]
MVAGYSNAAINEQTQLVTTFYVGIASFTILVWDHLLTLEDEIKYVWRRKKGPLIWLFFLNRYLTPLGFIVNLFAYFSDLFTDSVGHILPFDFVPLAYVCHIVDHFVRYEGSMTVIGINTAALMMLLRIYAMYDKNRVVVAFVAAVFCLELGTNAWLLTYGIAVRHSPYIHACTMIFDTSRLNKAAAAASAWLPLLYDTIVLALTIRRTYSDIKYPSVGRTMRTLLKEGVLYYSVIFCITLVLTLMIVLAPDGLKNVMAQTEYLMTVAMMSRITLHLKKEAHKTRDPLGSGTYDLTSSVLSQAGRRTPIAFADPSQRPSMVLSPLSISVQEHSVTYNDRGEEVQVPRKSHRTTHIKRYSYDADEQWFEFAPLSNPDGHRRR